MYAESISAWSNQGSVMCLLIILNQLKKYIYIYLSIYLIIQSELWIMNQLALTVNGNIYFYWNYSDSNSRLAIPQFYSSHRI